MGTGHGQLPGGASRAVSRGLPVCSLPALGNCWNPLISCPPEPPTSKWDVCISLCCCLFLCLDALPLCLSLSLLSLSLSLCLYSFLGKPRCLSAHLRGCPRVSVSSPAPHDGDAISQCCSWNPTETKLFCHGHTAIGTWGDLNPWLPVTRPGPCNPSGLPLP